MEFVGRQDAAVAASCIGVAPDQIDAIERQYRIALPSNYVDFLQTMGESSGGLPLFGATRVHSFSRVIARRPSDYPTEKFFKVAFESHNFAPALEDMYLDLARSDGHDAPLVRFELPLEPGDEPDEDPLSVTEKIISEIFWHLDVVRKKFAAKVLIFGGGVSGDPLRTKQDATVALAGLGFTTSLPDLPRVACMTQGAVSLLVSIDESLITFEFGGDSREEVEAPVKELLDVVPGAVLDEPPAPRTNS